MDTKITSTPVPGDPDGRTFNAIVRDHRSPYGAWCAEWDPETGQAMPLTDGDGEYIPTDIREAYL